MQKGFLAYLNNLKLYSGVQQNHNRAYSNDDGLCMEFDYIQLKQQCFINTLKRILYLPDTRHDRCASSNPRNEAIMAILEATPNPSK